MMTHNPSSITVAPASAASLDDLRHADFSFSVTQEVEAAFDRSIAASLKTVEPYEKHYFNDPQQFSSYIDNIDGALFIARLRDRVVGYLAISRHWNGLALIEDIAVDRVVRQSGVGSALMNVAVSWTRERHLSGVMLETQSNNVAACLFYEKKGFELGGIDRNLYRGLNPQRREVALFWYLWLEH